MGMGMGMGMPPLCYNPATPHWRVGIMDDTTDTVAHQRIDTDIDTLLNGQFLRLAAEWKSATAGLASPRAIAEHPAYRQIIALGQPALPLIFRDLQDNGGWWYPALRTLTGANPVPEYARGKPPLNDEAWLRWGRENGYA